MMAKNTELTIRGDSIQSLYGYFLKKTYIVNRRYQRKLIWTIEEKKSFIDSLIHGYPVPLILLAEVESSAKDGKKYEIIDGMQRMNAIMSFLEQEFDIDGNYFDLDTMGDTKFLKDKGNIKQEEPILDREICANLVRYTLPISVYQETEGDHVDEVFRRLNSGGRHLSKQELRQAGSITVFANLVRTISSNIRGDSSATDILDLKSMKNISINNKKLSYGINIDDIFWVKNSIIRKEKLRDSQDEEVIADLVAWAVLDEGLRSSSGILDQLYEYNVDKKETASIADNVAVQIQKIGEENIENNIQYVFDFIIDLISESTTKNFNTWLFPNTGKEANISRYFQILFNALYGLLIKKNLKVGDKSRLIKSLNGAGEKVITLSAGGGNWSQIEKQTQIDALTGVISKYFIEKEEKDISQNQWITRLESLLMQSSTEQTMYDFKVGLYDLTERSKFNKTAFSQIIKTLTAMANTLPGSTGYCILGVSDSLASATRYKEIYHKEGIPYSKFYITGLQDEAVTYQKDMDKYFTYIVQMIQSEPITERDRDYLCRHIKTVRYFDKDIVILQIQSGSEPSIYDDAFYVRHGSNVQVVDTKGYATLFQRFSKI